MFVQLKSSVEMGDMDARELTPMVAVDPFHLPQSEPLASPSTTRRRRAGT